MAGFVPYRKHQFGRQASFGTPIAAQRAYPFTGVPDVNLNWTDPEGDFGSIDPIAKPYRVAPDLTANLTDNALAYNNLPLLLSGFFGGDIDSTGGGTAKTWTYAPASLTVDAPDVFTYEFGDDGTDDWFQLSDGIIETVTFNGPDTMGPVTANPSWRFGSAFYEGATEAALQPTPTVPTGSLTVDTQATYVYLGDAKLYIDSDASDIGGTQISNALHSVQITLSHEVDQKRFADGNGFDLADYGPGKRTIEWQLQFAKTSDTVGVGSESDAWFSTTSIDRYVTLEFTSTAVAQTPSTFYSWRISCPLRYYTRADGEIGQNTTITLTGRAFYDDTLDYAVETEVVNTLAAADL